MTANRDLILAGVAGGGTGAALAQFAPKGSVMPSAATGTGSALDAAFLDGGWITEDGLTKSVDENSTDINAYGSQVPVRTLTTRSKVTFGLTFLESNLVALSLYNRLPLTGTGALSVTASTGALDFTEGAARTIEYGGVFDIVDGLNHIRAVVPVLQVTDRSEFSVKAGEAITYGVTLTAYPASDGVAIHWYYILNALKTA